MKSVRTVMTGLLATAALVPTSFIRLDAQDHGDNSVCPRYPGFRSEIVRCYPAPVYPEIAKRAWVGGTLTVLISSGAGRVVEVEPIHDEFYVGEWNVTTQQYEPRDIRGYPKEFLDSIREATKRWRIPADDSLQFEVKFVFKFQTDRNARRKYAIEYDEFDYRNIPKSITVVY